MNVLAALRRMADTRSPEMKRVSQLMMVLVQTDVAESVADILAILSCINNGDNNE